MPKSATTSSKLQRHKGIAWLRKIVLQLEVMSNTLWKEVLTPTTTRLDISQGSTMESQNGRAMPIASTGTASTTTSATSSMSVLGAATAPNGAKKSSRWCQQWSQRKTHSCHSLKLEKTDTGRKSQPFLVIVQLLSSGHGASSVFWLRLESVLRAATTKMLVSAMPALPGCVATK